MKEKFRLVIETMHVNDKGNLTNVSKNLLIFVVFCSGYLVIVLSHNGCCIGKNC